LVTGVGDGSTSIGVGSGGLIGFVGGGLEGGGNVGRGGGVEVRGIGIGVIMGANTAIVGAMREEAMTLVAGTEMFIKADDTTEVLGVGVGVDKV